MSKSVRVRHEKWSLLNFVVETQDALLAGPKVCPRCSRPNDPRSHATKALHIPLDANGDGFVSPEVWARYGPLLQMAGMTAVGEVTNAPAVQVGAVGTPQERVMTPQGEFYRPAVPQQVAERRVQAPFIPVLEAIAEKHDRAVTAKRAEKKRTFILNGGE